jgi:3-hydroxybutyryl-CoA dehydrogenase
LIGRHVATTLDDAIVTVMGAGTMGTGIAQVAAQAGHRVQLFDLRAGAAEAALTRLRTTMAGLVAKGRMTEISARNALDRLQPIGALEQAAASGIVIESIVEDMDAKRALLAQLEGIVPPQTVLASNTSSLSITAMANGLQHPGRVVGMHFFNPVPLMRLLELVRGLTTSEATAAAAADVGRRMGKEPVEAKDSPGFISNRILCPMINEAVFALQEGIGTAEAIDSVMKLGMSHPIGPLALADLIGLDVVLFVMQVLQRDLGEDKYRPAPLLRQMVDAGLLGRKSGRGFFSYNS